MGIYVLSVLVSVILTALKHVAILGLTKIFILEYRMIISYFA